MKRIKRVLNRLLSRQYSVRTQLFGITAFFICTGTFAILLANSQLIPLIYTLHQKNTLVTLSHRIESIIYTSNDFYSDMAVIEENNNNPSNVLLYDLVITQYKNLYDGSPAPNSR